HTRCEQRASCQRTRVRGAAMTLRWPHAVLGLRCRSMRIHLIGVCGTGMGALAGLLRDARHDVSGSDRAFYPPMGPALEAWGVRTLPGWDTANLDPAPDLVVVGN